MQVLSANTGITVSSVVPKTSALPTQDGKIDFDVTLTLGSQTVVKTISVDYKDLLNSTLAVSTSKEVNDTN